MLAIIPARGGSKGLPGKNIRHLLGKPLIAYTIEAALAVPAIKKVFVSTDDPEIANIALEFGAECGELRPAYLATDTARAVDVYTYVLEQFIDVGEYFNEVVILQPTSPLRTSKNILEAIELFKEKDADSVISYCEEHHPVVWHKYITREGKFEEIFGSYINNRQEERKSYYPNGAIYIFKKELLVSGRYYTENSYAYIMPRELSIDIDTLFDFKQAEFLLTENA